MNVFARSIRRSIGTRCASCVTWSPRNPLEDFRIPPGNRFKALEGDRSGRYSIRTSEIVHGKRGITADTVRRLAKYFGTSAEFWTNLQSHYELDRAEDLQDEQIATQAKEHGRSIEAEDPAILTRAACRPHIGTALLTAAQDVGGVNDLPIPVRDDLARAMMFFDGGGDEVELGFNMYAGLEDPPSAVAPLG